MTARGYTLSGYVRQALGRDLTVDELGMLDAWLLESIENQIDRRTGRTWLAGTVTAERYELGGPYVYLKQRPVTAVTLVTGKDWLDASTRALTAGTDYAVDLTTGRLILTNLIWPSAHYGYDYLEVSYTVPATVPADIRQAATLWAVASLSGAALAGGMAATYKRISTDGQTLEYRDPPTVDTVPPAVESILAGLARPMLA